MHYDNVGCRLDCQFVISYNERRIGYCSDIFHFRILLYTFIRLCKKKLFETKGKSLEEIEKSWNLGLNGDIKEETLKAIEKA